MHLVSLVEGIENLQVDYALDPDGDGTPEGAYVEEPATPAAWANVVAVRINVLARNLEPSAEADTKVYDMGARGTVTSTVGGGTLDPAYKRHVYNAVIRVVNPSARRETP
jgi:type IV pilus assembly protein PilW